MAKAGERKVGRTTDYKRADGRTITTRITALNGGTNVDLKTQGRPGVPGETFTNVAEMSLRSQTAVWVPGSRWRYAP